MIFLRLAYAVYAFLSQTGEKKNGKGENWGIFQSREVK